MTSYTTINTATKYDLNMFDLSIVIPVFNEAETLLPLHNRLRATLDQMAISWEVVFVDDGSKDDTRTILMMLKSHNPSISIVGLSRNFGKECAMSAGLKSAKGNAIIIIDADLQDPPELIPSMYQAWQNGADVVNMRRRNRRGETKLKKFTASAFYKVLNKISDLPIPEQVGDFRLLSRRAVDAINQLPETNRFMKGLFAWIGFNQVTIDFDRDPRFAGHSKWPYWKLWNLALEGITGFSTAPLKLATYIGFTCALSAFLYALFFLIETLVLGSATPGFPTIIISILMLGGAQLMAIGVLGEYLSRIFIESKQRPLYLVDIYQPAESSHVPRLSTVKTNNNVK